MKDWKIYRRTVAGVEFRPVSLGSLTLLFDINSPFVHGGLITAKDFAIFAWLHSQPLADVITAVKAETYEKEAIMWATEMPIEIYSSFSVDTIKALNKDLNKIFIDKDTGFIPFPLPYPCKPSRWRRAWIFMKRLLTFGLV